MRTAVTATVAGLVSAVVVAALILGAGIGDDGDGSSPPPPVAPASGASAPSIRSVFEHAERGIVRVDARPPGTPIPSGPPREDDGVATGTGFVIDRQGSIVTNDHVAEGGSKISVRFGQKGKRIDARLVGRDPGTDLALLRIDPKRADFDPLPLGDSRSVRVGDTAIAIGNPFGLERTLTLGVVSSTDREIDAPDGTPIRNAVQTDAAINPGNSGGPLLDAAGRVIGINSQGRGGASGIAFAVPVDTLERVLPNLRKGRRTERAFLGIAVAGDGRRIAQVERGGAARKAGLRKGDVIVSIEGQPVREPGDVAAAVAKHKPGDRIEVAVERNGRRVTVTATLGKR
jgi:S1-C subfamily serine protease